MTMMTSYYEFQTLLFWVGGFIVGWLILYFVIKKAVVNGIRDSGLLDTMQDRLTENKKTDRE